MSDETMHPAVELLLKRMESHPEEFANGEWRDIEQHLAEHTNGVEKIALGAKKREIVLGVVHKRIMKRLLEGEESPELNLNNPNKYSIQSLPKTQLWPNKRQP